MYERVGVNYLATYGFGVHLHTEKFDPYELYKKRMSPEEMHEEEWMDDVDTTYEIELYLNSFLKGYEEYLYFDQGWERFYKHFVNWVNLTEGTLQRFNQILIQIEEYYHRD